MRLHLVGSRSYVLSSVAELVSTQENLEVLRYSSAPSPEGGPYGALKLNFQSGDKILAVATPSDLDARSSERPWSLSAEIEGLLRDFGEHATCVSTIRVSQHSIAQNRYAKYNQEFLKVAVEAGARVCCLPNYWGRAPVDRPSQAGLAPWVFLRRRQNRIEQIAREPDKEIWFATPHLLLRDALSQWSGVRELSGLVGATPRDIVLRNRGLKDYRFSEQVKSDSSLPTRHQLLEYLALGLEAFSKSRGMQL